MKEFNALGQIKQEFRIDSDNLDIIKDKLNELRTTLHPDKTNGVFENEEIKEKYYTVNNAIEYIDKVKNNQSLVVVEKMTDLMKVITDLIPNSKNSSLETNLNINITNAISTYHSSLTFPKISLTIIAAVVTFIFLFPSLVKDSPSLSEVVDTTNPTFIIFWLMFLFSSAFLWFISYTSETNAKRKLIFLKVDSTQNLLFKSFLHFKNSDSVFTKDELTNFIYMYGDGRHSDPYLDDNQPSLEFVRKRFSLFKSEIITIEIAQNIAELILIRAEKNKIILKVESSSLSETYTITNNR
jgi:hypothetical protein